MLQMSPLFCLIAAIKAVWLVIMCTTSCNCSRLSFDCGMRELALEFASFLQPDLSSTQLNQIADALNGSPEKAPNCHVSPESVKQIETQDDNVGSITQYDDFYDEQYPFTIFVSPNTIANNKDKKHKIGTINNPYTNIHDAIDHTRYYRKQLQEEGNTNNVVFTIILRQGIHYILKPILLYSS